MKHIILFGLLLVFCSPISASESADPDPLNQELSEAADSFEAEDQLEEEDAFGEESEFEAEDSFEEGELSLLSRILSPARFTLMHGLSYKTESPTMMMNNRSSVRLEYAKLFGDTFFVQLDTKINAYWADDHRSGEEDLQLETNTREGFLQMSFGRTSLKLGRQIMIWGESDGGAITDVISPRDYSELFFISLQESRIGQTMLVVDQFTDFGDWSLFYISEPEFNEYPTEGTGYHDDPFAGQAEFLTDPSDERKAEFGLRWKKTFGKSDVALMSASLLENDYVYRPEGYSASSGKSIFTKTRQRFSMKGLAFNYVRGSFLFKGEMASKSPRSFNDASFQIVKKDVQDLAVGLEYAPGGTYSLGFEAVNSHVVDWEDTFLNTSEDANSAVIAISKTFLNEDLSVNWMSSYSNPQEAIFHSLRSAYTLNDNVKFEGDAFFPDIRSPENGSWIYRDQKQISFRALVQF
jgi:hypothetical protein